MTSPLPLTPVDCDLRDFPRMSIDIPRLFGSNFNAANSSQPIAWMVGLKLWCRSWHQVPAASLPADDAALCHLAELGSDVKQFAKIRDRAMHGWQPCADGRLYHPVVAEYALCAWLEKLNQRLGAGRGNASRWKTEFDPAPIEAGIIDSTRLLANLNPASPAITRVRRRASRRDNDGGAK